MRDEAAARDSQAGRLSGSSRHRVVARRSTNWINVDPHRMNFVYAASSAATSLLERPVGAADREPALIPGIFNEMRAVTALADPTLSLG